MSPKQKIVQSRGPSNINLGIFVCSFDVCLHHNQSPLLTMPILTHFSPLHGNYLYETWKNSKSTCLCTNLCKIEKITSVMNKLKYSRIDKIPFSEFQQSAAVETLAKFRNKSFLKSCLCSTWFMVNKFVFKLVVVCRVIKNTLRRKPSKLNWPEVRFFQQRINKHNIQ